MPSQILYESTNRNLSLDQLLRIKNIDQNIEGAFTDKVSFRDAIVMGQAPDTGLFAPERFPEITMDEIASLKGKPFADSAYLVFRKFLTKDEISDKDLRTLVEDAYTFEYPLINTDAKNYLLMHTESPTGDFKNTGARANARFLSYMRPEGMRYIRVTTTSGDTGGAVGLADHNVPGLISVVLYPQGHISDVQEQIMTSIGDNVIAIAVKDAMFTDCQDGLGKPAFADIELGKELAKYNFGLTSGNSINWGRVMPQIVHFVYSYAQVADPGETIIMSTPLGNMGHGLSGEMARRMGLPIFNVWPTNENDPFPRYMESGKYRPLTKEEENRDCKSNSMIVRNPSNLARLFYFFDGKVDKDGNVNEYPNNRELSRNVFSPRVSMKKENQTIKDVYEQYDIVIDPHGACAVNGLWQYQGVQSLSREIPTVTQITANPYKYKDHIKELIGVDVEKPKAYEWFDGRALTGTTMSKDYQKFKELLIDLAKNPEQFLKQ
jgi:threonine synthase